MTTNPHSLPYLVTCLLPVLACKGSSDADVPQGPHALGVIQISEVHASTGGAANASVATYFAPDTAAAAGQCTRTVAGCELPLKPDCNGTCGTDQACGFNGDCEAECTQICDARCESNQECYFPTESTSACREKQSFDGGTIALVGTTTPITLFPPYSFSGVDEGSLFLDGDEIQVRGTGATGPGYDAFEESFSATSLLRTSPALHDLPLADVFGTGDIPIQWTAGKDEVFIAASVTGKQGESGSVSCKADDQSGTFALPREAIAAALEGGQLHRMSISVTRKKTTLVTGIGTHGELHDTIVQPDGWLELSTQSTEHAAIEGCQLSEALCDNQCIDTQYDDQNCGGCGIDCGAGGTCNNGTCSGEMACSSCVPEAETGVCASATNACQSNASCMNLRSCLTACTTQDCIGACFEEFPEGQPLHSDWVMCICNTGCSIECAAGCQQ